MPTSTPLIAIRPSALASVDGAANAILVGENAGRLMFTARVPAGLPRPRPSLSDLVALRICLQFALAGNLRLPILDPGWATRYQIRLQVGTVSACSDIECFAHGVSVQSVHQRVPIACVIVVTTRPARRTCAVARTLAIVDAVRGLHDPHVEGE